MFGKFNRYFWLNAHKGRVTRHIYGISLTVLVGIAIYPIIIQPYYNPDEWRSISAQTRDQAGIKQSDIQPGNMRVWQDPFDRKK